MKKKLLMIGMTAVLTATALCACNGKSAPDVLPTETVESVFEESAESVADTEASTESMVETDTEADVETEAESK